MKSVEVDQHTRLGDADLDRMVGPDPHRPGPARWRLLAEQIPIRAIIGHIGAIAGTTEPTALSDEIIAQAAADYDVSTDAVLASLKYYSGHRGAIDALLEANEAALNQRVPNFRFALDEDVSHPLAGLLRSRGLDIDSAKDLGRLGLTDPQVFLRAAEAGQTLVTHNNDDFLMLHEAWLTWRTQWENEASQFAGIRLSFSRHAGILILPHSTVHELAEMVEAFDDSLGAIGDRIFSWNVASGWHEVGLLGRRG